MYKRKTQDEYQIITDYGYGPEVELVEYSFKDAKIRVKEYERNAQGLRSIKIVKKQVKLEAV